MNTQKQVLVMSVLMMMTLIVLGIYAAWVPSRSDNAEAHFQERTAERGAILFARNCRLCHGDQAEGGTLAGRLPGSAALNRPDLQGFEQVDAQIVAQITPLDTTFEISDPDAVSEGDVILIGAERMLVTRVNGSEITVVRGFGHTQATPHFTGAPIWGFDSALLSDAQTFLNNTIVCGRVGTAMPPWSLEHGGALNDEQIRQLIVLITDGRWELTEEEILHEDEIGAFLAGPVEGDPDATQIQVTDITRFEEGNVIRVGLEGERMRVESIPDFDEQAQNIPGTLTVERGVLNTFAQAYPAGEELLRYPEPAEPTILEMSCGQRAQAPAPTGPCQTENGVVQIGAINNTFTCSEIRAQANSQVRVALENQEAVPHNIAFYNSEDDLTPVTSGSVGPVFPGPDVTQELTFTAPAAGEYFFKCDVHPLTMRGTFLVE